MYRRIMRYLLLLTSDLSPRFTYRVSSELEKRIAAPRCNSRVDRRPYEMRKEHFSRRSLMRKHDPHNRVPGNKAHRFIMTESSNYVPVTITRCPNIPYRASRNKRSARFFFTRHVSLALPSPVVRLLRTVSPKQVYEIFETAGSSLLHEIGSRSLNRPFAISLVRATLSATCLF